MSSRKFVMSALTVLTYGVANAQVPPQMQGQAAALTIPAAAADSPEPALRGPGSRLQKIIDLSEQRVLLEQQLKVAETELQLATKRSELGKLSGDDGSGASLPVIKGISGVDGQLRATLVWSGGIESVVKTGDSTRGSFTVKSIDHSSVVLAGRGKTVRLGFGTEPPSGSANPSSPTRY